MCGISEYLQFMEVYMEKELDGYDIERPSIPMAKLLRPNLPDRSCEEQPVSDPCSAELQKRL